MRTLASESLAGGGCNPGRGQARPEPQRLIEAFAVNALFEDMRREFASVAGSKGLRLEVTPYDDSAHSDASLVGQILRNLVSNAIKYTHQGWVLLRCLHDLPSIVRIEFLDTGIGIPPEQLRFIYDEFFQVSVPANTTREGYGLGLSIVRRLVTPLDARLDVRSEVGKGIGVYAHFTGGVCCGPSSATRAAASARCTCAGPDPSYRR